MLIVSMIVKHERKIKGSWGYLRKERIFLVMNNKSTSKVNTAN